ncbi:hypothetical protein D3C86_1925170 [compost metagenome]
MREKTQRLVVAGIAAVPGPGLAQAGGILGKQGALAITEGGGDQGQQATSFGGCLQALQQLRSHNCAGR